MTHEYSRRALYAAGEPLGACVTRREAGRLVCGGGGGDSSSTTVPTIPEEFKPLARLYTQQATQIAATPWQAYGGQRYADLNRTQQAGIGMVQQRALGGDPTLNTATGALQQTAGGGYLGAQAAGNPYAGATNPYAGVSNQYAGVQNSAATAANPYASESNPYLQQNIDAALGDLTRNYNLAVRPQLDTMDARSGSFGNSGVQQMQGEAARLLAQQMGSTAAGMRSADYNQRAQLNENATNRQFQAGAQTQQNLYNAGQQQAQNLYGAGSQLAQQQYGAGSQWAQSQNSLFDAERNRQMQSLQLAPTYANQAYQDAGQLLNVGNLQQQSQQNGLDFAYQQFQDQQNHPYKQIQATGSVLGQNMGSSTTQNGGK